MEEGDKDPEQEPDASVLPENQDAKKGVPTQEPEEEPCVEFKEERCESQPQEEEVEGSEKLITPQTIINLQRDLQTLVTNIQTAADARESMRRTEFEEARRLRLERLENDVKSSHETFEAITTGWSIAKQKVIRQELQEALNNQQQLCAALIEDKKKLINYLQQELKVGDDRYVKDLRKQAEELDLMMERMEDHIKNLTKTYRDELAQLERVFQQESEDLLIRDETEWEQHMKNLWDKELERLTQRKTEVEEYEATIHNLMLETAENTNIIQIEYNAKLQVLEREHQQMKGTRMLKKVKQLNPRGGNAQPKFSSLTLKTRIASLQTKINNLTTKCTNQKKEFTKRSRYLSEDYKRKVQQYERIQKKLEHVAFAGVRQFEEMWLMIEAEVKQLVERALVIDSLICKQHLGLAWKRPPMAFLELSGPIQPQKQAWRPGRQAGTQLFHTGQALQCSERMMDASVGPRLEPDTESTDMEMYKEGTAAQSESAADVNDGKLSRETLKKAMELLCDEAGFLLEDELLNLLAPLEKEEQTIVKLASLLSIFGIEEEDVPKLVNFLFKDKHRQREGTECSVCLQDVCVKSGETSDKAEEVETHLTSELIDPNHVVPALKSFLEQLMRSRESSAHQQPSFQHVEARDTSEDEAYWESMGNIISEDRLKLWDAAENTLNQYHAVLTEICELVPETQSLEQQNTELRMLLLQSLNSEVSTELEGL